ncbi:MAG: hypothetical protein ACOCUT_00150 [bacterium]
MDTFATQIHPEEIPEIDDSIKHCPDCETPTQFGERCDYCQRLQDEEDEKFSSHRK